MALSGQGRKEPGVTSAWWRRLPRAVRVLLRIALALIVLFTVATARVLIWPALAQGMPAKVSAIVMLAGPGDRLPVALELVGQHRAPVLVVSQGYDGYGGACPPRPAGTQLICFEPNPPTTRGEAEYVGRLAAKYHWASLLVVTSRPQAIRARILVGRCFAGTIYTSTAPLAKRDWPYQIAYGWGALAKDLIQYRNC